MRLQRTAGNSRELRRAHTNDLRWRTLLSFLLSMRHSRAVSDLPPFGASNICAFSAATRHYVHRGAGIGLSMGGGVPPWLPATGSNAFSQFVPFVGYFLAGCWLARANSAGAWVPACVAVFATLLFTSTIGTYFFVSTHGLELGRYLYSYLSPPVILMAICVFLVLRALTERREARGPIHHIRALHFVGEATFGIFLIHPFLFSLWGTCRPRYRRPDTDSPCGYRQPSQGSWSSLLSSRWR